MNQNYKRKMQHAYLKVWRFLTQDIWRTTTQDVSGISRWLINVVKSLILSVRFFIGDRMQEKASALTYNTLLAIVPAVALLLGVAKGFGFQDHIQQSLQTSFAGQSEVIGYCFQFADNYLAQTKTGLIMGVGTVLLLWVIISLISNIETVFNQIWQQGQSRTTLRKFTDYLSIIILFPIFILLSSGIQIFVTTIAQSGYLDQMFNDAMLRTLRIAPYILTMLVFSLAYIVIPNTKVEFKSAVIAGSIAGAGFLIFQDLYISGQIWVSKYNAIYGSFAALPLLLLWVQMSWLICLYGAELAYASQNVSNFNFERDIKNISRRYLDFLTLVTAGIVYNKFKNEEKVTTVDIAQALQLPSKLTDQIINHLEKLEIIHDTIDKNRKDDQHWWIPGVDINKLTVGDLLRRINVSGSENFRIRYSSKFPKEWEIINTIQDRTTTEANLLVCDLNITNHRDTALQQPQSTNS